LVFFNLDLCSATLMECSRREVLNYMAEHEPILKNNQNKFYPRLGFTQKLVAFPKMEQVLFYCGKTKNSFTFQEHVSVSRYFWNSLGIASFVFRRKTADFSNKHVKANTPKTYFSRIDVIPRCHPFVKNFLFSNGS